MFGKTAKSFTAIILLTICATLFTALLPVSAAAKLDSTVNIAAATKNQSGEGYYWHNPSSTLTLSGLNVETSDDYGLKLKANSTVVLEGDNYISASKAALYCAGTVVIKGSGTLTLVSDNMGIYVNTTKNTDKVSLVGVKTSITAGGEGIRSDKAEFTVNGGTLTISAAGDYAVNARSFAAGGQAQLKADNTLYGTLKLSLSGVDADITSSKAALMHGEYFILDNMTVGVDGYADENSFSAKSTYVKKATSALFGDKYPVALDVVVLVLTAVALAAVIVLPIMYHKRKTAEVERRRAEAKASARITKPVK